jgi:hypothetical protein
MATAHHRHTFPEDLLMSFVFFIEIPNVAPGTVHEFAQLT